MQKIKALHQFIVDLNLVAAEQVDSFVDDPKITPCCRPGENPGELIVAEKDYTATFNIERYPQKLDGVTEAEDALFAQISTWLIEQDSERLDSAIFDIIVEDLDASTVNLEFGIQFHELIVATEDAGGTIQYNGTQYSLP